MRENVDLVVNALGFYGGSSWVEHNPLKHDGKYNLIEDFKDDRFYAPEGVNAYHKHDCLAVLGRGDNAIIQLATWVKHLESLGEIEIVEYETGATGTQALFTGLIGKTIRLKPVQKKRISNY